MGRGWSTANGVVGGSIVARAPEVLKHIELPRVLVAGDESEDERVVHPCEDLLLAHHVREHLMLEYLQSWSTHNRS